MPWVKGQIMGFRGGRALGAGDTHRSEESQRRILRVQHRGRGQRLVRVDSREKAVRDMLYENMLSWSLKTLKTGLRFRLYPAGQGRLPSRS